MGNKNQKQNDNFGQNYNITEHNRKMAEMNHIYYNHDLTIPNNNRQKKNITQQTRFNILRKNAIYKPSIQIKIQNCQIYIHFQYYSQNGCNFIMYASVDNIQQDLNTQKTIKINALYEFHEQLKSGKKQKAIFRYKIDNTNKIQQQQLILRIQSADQASEYQFRKGSKNLSPWIIILEKLQTSNQSYEIENIYKGGEQEQDCIVCMSQPSTTMVKPCNHMCLCHECAETLGKSSDKCPICRKNIQGLVTLKS